MRELKVNAIENGSVIDHVDSNVVFKILDILNFKESSEEILIGTNLPTKKGNSKGVLKISNTFFTPNQISKIAILSPDATLNIIKNFEVSEKFKVKIPEKICNIIKCHNPNCITNCEKIATKFEVLDKVVLKLKCNYCEKIVIEKNIEVI